MIKILTALKKFFKWKENLRAEVERQLVEGYSIEMSQSGPERYITYKEGKRELNIQANFTILNDVILYTNSLERWEVPRGEELTPFDFQKVMNRAIRYFECWGDVILDNQKLTTADDLKATLREAGIEFEELDGGVLRYRSTVREEQTRDGGILKEDGYRGNRKL